MLRALFGVLNSSEDGASNALGSLFQYSTGSVMKTYLIAISHTSTWVLCVERSGFFSIGTD